MGGPLELEQLRPVGRRERRVVEQELRVSEDDREDVTEIVYGRCLRADRRPLEQRLGRSAGKWPRRAIHGAARRGADVRAGGGVRGAT